MATIRFMSINFLFSSHAAATWRTVVVSWIGAKYTHSHTVLLLYNESSANINLLFAANSQS
jgi:hypothetical protein